MTTTIPGIAPETICPVCSAKWGKQLWARSCACNGGVDLVFRMPGKALKTDKPKPVTHQLTNKERSTTRTSLGFKPNEPEK